MKTKSNQFLSLIFAAISLVVYLFLPLFNSSLLGLNDVNGWAVIQNIGNLIEGASTNISQLTIFSILMIVFLIMPTVGGVLSVLGGIFGNAKTVKSGAGLGIAGLICTFILLLVTPIIMASELEVYIAFVELFTGYISSMGVGFWGALVGFILTSLFSKAK